MGVDHVVQSKVQSLQREFENLAMTKEEKVSDFSSHFIKIISKLRDLISETPVKDTSRQA